ncbi:MAG: DNA-protecting protein DprA [Clostridia bacterium]|nr:DNA-protecting protein DprA [Clostridia bacterium]
MNISDRSDILVIPRSSELYPAEWKTIKDAPTELYAKGNTALLENRKFTVVGSRRTPVNALKLGMTVSAELAHTFTIVTGCADGGDLAAIEGGLMGANKVICVLAGGFGALPQSNLPLLERVARNGLLLALHPYDTAVRSFSYEYRNKLLAALGEGTLVLGAGETSGALITAKYAVKAQKPTFAFPYPPNSAVGCGCNGLIKNGAYLTENAQDIFDKLGVKATAAEKPKVPLTADEEKMLSALRELTEGHINELSAKAGVPVFRTRAVLSALEVKGLAVSVGGNRYAPV